MQLPRMTGVQAILGLVMLFALGGQVSLALAMRECIKRHNFGCNTESRGFLLPAHAPTSTNPMIRGLFGTTVFFNATDPRNVSEEHR